MQLCAAIRLSGCPTVWLWAVRAAVWWYGFGCAAVRLWGCAAGCMVVWLCVGVVEGGAPWLREWGCGCDCLRGCVAYIYSFARPSTFDLLSNKWR